jgi:hypothetical protein
MALKITECSFARKREEHDGGSDKERRCRRNMGETREGDRNRKWITRRREKFFLSRSMYKVVQI